MIAQHRHPDSLEGTFVQLLQQHTRRAVVDAEDKVAIEPRHVYVAPPNYHLLVERGWLALSVDAHVSHARPSIDVLFESAAHAYARACNRHHPHRRQRGRRCRSRGDQAPRRGRGDPGSRRRDQAVDAGGGDRGDGRRRSAAARGDREVRLRAVYVPCRRLVREADWRPRGRDGGDPARRRPPREPARARGHPRAARTAAPVRALRRGRAAPAAPARRRGDPARRPDAGARRLRDGGADQAARAHPSHPDHLRDGDLQGRAAGVPRLFGRRRRLRLQALQPGRAAFEGVRLHRAAREDASSSSVRRSS